MAISEAEKAFAAHVIDILQGVGLLYSKRMFGALGVFLEGMMFGLIADNELYLKVDADNRLLHRPKSVTLAGSNEIPIWGKS